MYKPKELNAIHARFIARNAHNKKQSHEHGKEKGTNA